MEDYNAPSWLSGKNKIFKMATYSLCVQITELSSEICFLICKVKCMYKRGTPG